MPVEYEIIAVRYGEFQTSRSHNFYSYATYGEPDAGLQLDYYFWIIRDDTSVILVDTGFNPASLASRPGRKNFFTSPLFALDKLDIEAEDVSRIIVTHFHYDHIGNNSLFPNARFTVQRRELDFWLGSHGRYRAVASNAEVGEIEFMRETYINGRIDCVDGSGTVLPSVQVELMAGHTPGQQIVKVQGDRPIVLASDSLHFYEEMDRDMPFQVFTDLPGMYDSYQRLRLLRDQEDAEIVAGHDPQVMDKFPRVGGLRGDLAVRIR